MGTEHLDGSTRSVSWRIDALLALALLLLSGPLVHEFSGYPAVRYALTVAVVDDHSLEIDPYEEFIGIDRASYRGHLYSHTAPYQSLLAVPLHQVYRWTGAESFPRINGGYAARDGDLTDPDLVLRGMWWATLWTSVLPGVALVIALRRFVARRYPELGTRVALALVAGTAILPFTSVFFGHVLAALAVIGAWSCVTSEDRSQRSMVIAGLWLGLGIGTEYTVALPALACLVIVVLARRGRAVAALSGGTLIAVAPLLVYNWLVFENPFETAYQGHLPYFEGAGAAGVYNLQLPRLDEVGRALLGDRGLFTQTPIMLLAVAGCIWAIRSRTPARVDAWVALTTLVAMVVVSTGIDGYGGASAGPRYLITVLPLFARPLVEAWRRLPFLCAGTAVIGAVTMVVATITGPLRGPAPPLSSWYDDLLHGRLADNALTGGSQHWIVYGTTAAAISVVAWALHLDRTTRVTVAPPGRSTVERPVPPM